MGVIRFFARLMLAPVFIYGGMNTLQNPNPRIKIAASAGTPDAEILVRLNAGWMVVGGTMLALGILHRMAALLLAGSLIPTTLAGHRFWEEQGQARERQMTQFFKNMAAIGGLLLYTFGG